jgi:tol-pal system protein YbgF
MTKRLLSGILLSLLIPCIIAGQSKSKRTYELIYEDVQRLKQQILSIEQNIEKNSEDVKAIKNLLSEILTLSKSLQSEQASIKEEQKRLPSQYQILVSKIDAVNFQINRFSQELLELKRATLVAEAQAVEGEEAGTEQPPSEKTEVQEETEESGQQEEEPPVQIRSDLSPQEVYNMAYSDYLKGNFQLAIDGFKIYLQQFPESPIVDNALYWVGECYFSQKNYTEAIDRYNELILNYPEGDKTPAAYLKKGISLMELDRKEEALSAFKLLISKYPFEEETKIAQQKIKELESK